MVEKREEEFTIHPLAPELRIDTYWAVAKRPHISESLSVSGLIHPPLSPGPTALDLPYVALFHADGPQTLILHCLKANAGVNIPTPLNLGTAAVYVKKLSLIALFILCVFYSQQT